MYWIFIFWDSYFNVVFFFNDNANRLSQDITALILLNYSLIMNFSRFKQCSSNNMRKFQDFPSKTHPLTCQLSTENRKYLETLHFKCHDRTQMITLKIGARRPEYFRLKKRCQHFSFNIYCKSPKSS